MIDFTSSTNVTTVYKKAVVYFRIDIEYSDDDELQHKIDDFEDELYLDLDNLPSGNFDYEFSYDGIDDSSENEIPAWLFD